MRIAQVRQKLEDKRICYVGFMKARMKVMKGCYN